MRILIFLLTLGTTICFRIGTAEAQSRPKVGTTGITKEQNRGKFLAPILRVILNGEVILLEEAPQGAIWIEHRAVLEPKVDGKQVWIRGKKKGQSLLRVGRTQYKILVADQESKETFFLLKKWVPYCNDLILDFQNGEIVIDGKLSDLSIWLQLQSLRREDWTLRAAVSEELKLEVNTYLNLKIREEGAFSPVRIEWNPNPHVYVPKDARKWNPKLLRLIATFGIDIEEESTLIAVEPLVRITMVLAEVRKSYMRNLGIDWPHQFSSTILNSKFQPGEWSPDLIASALEKKGVGHVLAKPVLLAKSGAEAEFLAGGEIPIKIFSNKTSDVVWKKYGILLKIKPRVDSQRRIHLGIETEVSSIDSGQKVDGIPALFMNRIQSQFDLLEAQTILLSGMVKKIDGNAKQGLPGLSDIPILGALFTSQEYQEDKTDLLVWVTPEIL